MRAMFLFHAGDDHHRQTAVPSLLFAALVLSPEDGGSLRSVLLLLLLFLLLDGPQPPRPKKSTLQPSSPPKPDTYYSPFLPFFFFPFPPPLFFRSSLSLSLSLSLSPPFDPPSLLAAASVAAGYLGSFESKLAHETTFYSPPPYSSAERERERKRKRGERKGGEESSAKGRQPMYKEGGRRRPYKGLILGRRRRSLKGREGRRSGAGVFLPEVPIPKRGGGGEREGSLRLFLLAE